MEKEELFKKIMGRIREEQRIAAARKKLAVFSIIAIISLTALVPIFKIFSADVYNSGILEYFSLIFSDFRTIAIYWQSFALLLLETTPVASLALFLAAIFVFLESIRSAAKNINIIFNKKYGYQ